MIDSEISRCALSTNSLIEYSAQGGPIDVAVLNAESDNATGELIQRAQRKPTVNVGAWDCYHLGRAHMYAFTKEGNGEAQKLFRRAIELDARFAQAMLVRRMIGQGGLRALWPESRRCNIRASMTAVGRKRQFAFT